MKPFVSLITPTFNEGKYIRKCLEHLLKQTYPLNRFEILIADGNSSDDTVQIVNEFRKKHKKLNIRLLKNPKRNTAIGRNICLENAKGDIVINYSGHAYAKNDFIEVLVSTLLRAGRKDSRIMAVGASNFAPKDQTFTTKCTSIVFGSIFGGVTAVYQNMLLDKEKTIQSMAFTAYYRKVFSKIGPFDPEAWVGQDGELNLRLNKAGYKLLYTPKTWVHLEKRSTLSKYWRQMYRYGKGAYWRIRKHPDSFRLVYLIPSLFTLYIVAGVILSFIYKVISYLFIGSLAVYSIIGIITSLMIYKRVGANIPAVIVSPFFYLIEHFGYGLGFLVGLSGRKFR